MEIQSLEKAKGKPLPYLKSIHSNLGILEKVNAQRARIKDERGSKVT